MEYQINIYWIAFLFFMAIPGCILIAQALTKKGGDDIEQDNKES